MNNKDNKLFSKLILTAVVSSLTYFAISQLQNDKKHYFCYKMDTKKAKKAIDNVIDNINDMM